MAEDAGSKYVAITDTFGYVSDIKTAEDVVKNFEIESRSKFTVFYNKADEVHGLGIERKHKVYFEDSNNAQGHRLIYDGVPFIIVRRKVYDCQYGVDRHVTDKKKYHASRKDGDHASYGKRRRISFQNTKKLGCPAKIVIKEIRRFPDYRIPQDSEKRRKLASQRLRVALQGARETLQGEARVYISFPTASQHQGHSIGEREVESVPLFDGEILKDIDLSKGNCKLHEHGLSPSNAGHPFCMRPLCSDDSEKDFLGLLSQLTKVGDLTKEMFLKRFNSMQACPGTYYVLVVENTDLRKIVACGTLVVEQKFIHEAALRGRVEDIVVGESCRGKKLGKLIVETLLLLSKKLGCYKTSLECGDPLYSFYTQFGFNTEKGQNYLCKRFYH